MATTERSFIGAGFNRVIVFRKNADGVIIGNDSTEPVAGSSTGTSGLLIEGAQTVDVQIPDSDVVDVLGDDVLMVQFDFGSPTLPSGTLQLAARNLYLEAMVQNTTVYKPNSTTAIEIGTLMPGEEDLADLALLLQRRAKDWTPGSRGTKQWEQLFIPSCTMSAKGPAGITQRQHDPYRMFISVSMGDLFPWGETFSGGTVGTGSAAFTPVKTDYGYWVDIFKGNGVQDTFSLSKTPITTGEAAVSQNKILTATAGYTISAAPDQITFTVAPASNAYVQVFYPIATSEFTT